LDISTFAGNLGQAVGGGDANTNNTHPQTNKININAKGGLFALRNKDEAQKVMMKAIKRKSTFHFDKRLSGTAIRNNVPRKRISIVSFEIKPKEELEL
jgi:histone acetyltransferase (RNA polymerase elongator complex component)